MVMSMAAVLSNASASALACLIIAFQLQQRQFFSLLLFRRRRGLQVGDLQFRDGGAAGIHLAALLHQRRGKRSGPLSFRFGQLVQQLA